MLKDSRRLTDVAKKVFSKEAIACLEICIILGHILKIFYIIGLEDSAEDIQSIKIDLNKPSQYGFTFLTLYNSVQTDFHPLESSYPSVTYQVDMVHPRAEGDVRCKVLRGKTAAKYYTGFTPVLKSYNGENGLIKQIVVYKCDPAFNELAEDVAGDTHDCSDDIFPMYKFCKSVLFLWSPGSEGEILREGTGLEGGKDHYLLLQVIYNPTTGFLSDNSGVRLFYTHQEREQVGRVVVGRHRRLIPATIPRMVDSTVVGFCSKQCMARASNTRIVITSVSLHAGDMAKNIRLGVGMTGDWRLIAAGYNPDYQPVRQVDTTQRVNMDQEDIVVECEYKIRTKNMKENDCFALVTTLPKINLLECTSELELDARNAYQTFSIHCTNNDLQNMTISGQSKPLLGQHIKTNDCQNQSAAENNPYEEEVVSSGSSWPEDTTTMMADRYKNKATSSTLDSNAEITTDIAPSILILATMNDTNILDNKVTEDKEIITTRTPQYENNTVLGNVTNHTELKAEIRSEKNLTDEKDVEVLDFNGEREGGDMDNIKLQDGSENVTNKDVSIDKSFKKNSSNDINNTPIIIILRTFLVKLFLHSYDLI